MNLPTSAIIVAAGSSRRMGFNKLLAPLAGVPVLRRSLLAFAACAEVDEVLVVAAGEVAEAVEQWRAEGGMTKLRAVVPGGAERHLSVWAGLEAVSTGCQVVAVHDGARPLIRPQQIAACIHKAVESGSGVCARPVTETLKRVDEQGRVTDAVERDGVWVMETPQVFAVGLLRRAYASVMRDGLTVTDEVSAVRHLGEPVHVVENGWPNLKITFPADLDLATRLWEDLEA